MRFWSVLNRGFSLVEIAIVLVVVGLIISGGLMGISPVLQANKVTQTNQQMDKIDQALELYVIQNGCLPCPANPSPGTGPTGLEANGSTSGTPVHCSSTACTTTFGPVPWVALGLSKSDALDAYGYYFDYTPSPLLTESNTAMARTPPSSYPVGALTVTDMTPTTQTSVAAYVLISHGSDGFSGYTAGNGALNTLGGNNTKPQSCNTLAHTICTSPYTAGTYVQDTPKGANSTNGYFDDIVRFRTAPVIIQSCGANACGNPA